MKKSQPYDMSNTPIHTFFTSMESFHPHDVAVLFGLVAAQELNDGEIINPGVSRRLWSVELEPHELSDSIRRLVDAGEVERVMMPDLNEVNGGEPVLAGFKVVRFGQIQDAMTDFGKRRYHRIKSKEHRAREGVV